MKNVAVIFSLVVLMTSIGLTQEFILTASDGQTLDSFGGAVDIEGDYAYIGARLDDDAGIDAGAVYIFRNDTADWLEHQKLTPADSQVDGRFGRSVAVNGDYLVAGAHRADNTAGAAYVFLKTGDIWTQQAKLVSADPDSGDFFGLSVGISGDFIIVGAFGDDEAGDSTGAAYIFQRTGTTWSQTAKLTASDASVDDRFGWAVTIDGDFAAVGSHGDDPQGSASGSVYLFHYDGASWTEMTKLTASDGSPSDDFGFSLDLNGNTLIVGALNAETNCSGAAYIFSNDAMVWTESAKLIPSDADSNDKFGTSVAVEGGIAVVGAGKKDDSTGASYIFQQVGGSWSQESKLVGTGVMVGDEFGRDVAISGLTVLIGALNADGLAVNTGSAFLYENVTVSVAYEPATIPASMRLDQNYPNPFNPATMITFLLSEGGNVELTVYNILGQEIRSLVQGYLEAGTHTTQWDGLSGTGEEMAAGIYLYRLKTGTEVQTRKMTLLK